MDNSGVIYLANDWSVRGRMRHIDMQHYFVCKLKGQGLLIITYIAGDDNEMDIFTKNVTSAVFNCQVALYVGLNEYIQKQGWALSWEAVSDQICSNLEQEK